MAPPDAGADASAAKPDDAAQPEAVLDGVESSTDDDAASVSMKTLRQTTSPHDDWLYRGPYMHSLPFHTYAEYVDRVRHVKKKHVGNADLSLRRPLRIGPFILSNHHHASPRARIGSSSIFTA